MLPHMNRGRNPPENTKNGRLIGTQVPTRNIANLLLLRATVPFRAAIAGITAIRITEPILPTSTSSPNLRMVQGLKGSEIR